MCRPNGPQASSALNNRRAQVHSAFSLWKQRGLLWCRTADFTPCNYTASLKGPLHRYSPGPQRAAVRSSGSDQLHLVANELVKTAAGGDPFSASAAPSLMSSTVTLPAVEDTVRAKTRGSDSVPEN